MNESSSSTHVARQKPSIAPRLWITFLWALILGSALGGFDWVERATARKAAGASLILLPDSPVDEAQRTSLRNQLAAERGVASVRWVTPEELKREIERAFPATAADDGLLPDEAPWLPWLLEVRPVSPMDNLSVIHALLYKYRRDEKGWQVFWNAEPLQALARLRTIARIAFASIILLLGVGGVLVLAQLPSPAHLRVKAITWGAFLGAGGPLLLALALKWGAGEFDFRATGLAVGAGFLLATLIAPMIRQKHPAPTLSIKVSDDDAE